MMSRSRTDLAYTEARSRSNSVPTGAQVGVSSPDSIAVENAIEAMEKRASEDYGNFYLENATETEF